MKQRRFTEKPSGNDDMQVATTMKGGRMHWLRKSTFAGPWALCAAMAGVLVGALALSVASASAEVTHPFVGSITEANGSPLKEPWGMAFDGGGNLPASGAQAFAAGHKFSK